MNVEKDLKSLANIQNDDIDLSDIPEISDWSTAKRGQFYRPVKQKVTIRIDADVLELFKHNASQYQTAINNALRNYIKTQL